MKLQQYFQAYEFDEVFPHVGLMYQPARRQKEAFRTAYEMLCDMESVPSKPAIRYELMQDPDSGEMFCGADDRDFRASWASLLGKDVRKASGADLTDVELVANCLLNVVLLGRCPRSFEPMRRRLTGGAR